MKSPYRATVDLFLVLAWTGLAVGAVLGLPPSPIRILLALPVVLLFPGYALTAALFPRRQEGPRVRRSSTQEGGAALTQLERFALSITTSLALVPASAFVLNFTPFGITPAAVLFVVSGLTVGLTIAAYLARVSVPTDSRYRIPLTLPGTALAYLFRRPDSLRTPSPFEPTTETQRLFNLVFVVGLLVAAASFGYAAVTPAGDQGPYTEFYLLTQTDDGEYVSENLPHDFTRGESRSLYVAVRNHEGQFVEYTVVVTLGGDTIDQFQVRAGAGETNRVHRPVTPDRSGDRLRLSYLLYRGDPPDQPTRRNAYRSVHLWISVQ